MNPAVDRLLAEREAQGLGRHVEDEGALAQIADLLFNTNDAAPEDGAAVTTRTPTRASKGKDRRAGS
jgi:hypothetical protein